MFSLEYKPGVSQGGSVICPISSLTMSQVFLGIREALLDQREKLAQGANSVTRELKELRWYDVSRAAN
jgi:hypothetical protein